MSLRKGLTTPEQIAQMRKELADGVNNKKLFKRRSKQRIINGVFTSIFILFLLLFGSIMNQKNDGKIPHIFGYYIFSVESGSMSPTLEVGDIFISKKPSSTNDLAIGTIVTFYNPDGQIVTHRITDIQTDDSQSIVYQTKGDYELNTIDPDLLSQDRIISVYCFTVIRS